MVTKDKENTVSQKNLRKLKVLETLDFRRFRNGL